MKEENTSKNMQNANENAYFPHSKKKKTTKKKRKKK
jgi:hypothetical protein